MRQRSCIRKMDQSLICPDLYHLAAVIQIGYFQNQFGFEGSRFTGA
jgi:hypothetical protein